MRFEPYCHAARFQLLDAHGQVAGRLSSGVYVRPDSQQYAGTVITEDGFSTVYDRSRGRLGVIKGLKLLLDDGQVLTLRPQTIEQAPGTARRIEDAYAFQSALELYQRAQEADQADTEKARALALKIALAAFYACPLCIGLPDDDCELCRGFGFVSEGVAEDV